jgi:hypothetical protein
MCKRRRHGGAVSSIYWPRSSLSKSFYLVCDNAAIFLFEWRIRPRDYGVISTGRVVTKWHQTVEGNEKIVNLSVLFPNTNNQPRSFPCIPRNTFSNKPRCSLMKSVYVYNEHSLIKGYWPFRMKFSWKQRICTRCDIYQLQGLYKDGPCSAHCTRMRPEGACI